MREGLGGVAEAPRMVADPVDDHRLVAAVRRGDDRAFETLYARYRRRIAAYVLGMVKDHGRAEDVTQEVFVSALRRMRETERPIAFKPWIYEIAKNACIDQYRRSRRTEEVSYDADDGGLAPKDYGRLVGSDSTPDAAIAAKQDLDTLCGAFGGLSDTHHEILVLRELEGLSYREIGQRMGLSRPAVESTLFRARRRLTEEYDELASGARCRRVQDLIATAADTALGARESRRLARHVSHCQPCRREAIAAGLDSDVLTHVPLRRRAAAKIAALLPIPWLARFGRGRGAGDEAAASAAGPSTSGWLTQLPLMSDQLSAGWGKAVAVAAVAVAGFGAAGVGTQVGKGHGAPQGQPATEQGTAASQPVRGGAEADRGRAATKGGKRENGARDRAGNRAKARRAKDGRVGSAGGGGGGGPGGGEATDSPTSGSGTGGGTPGGEAQANGGGGTGQSGNPAVPPVRAPVSGGNPAGPAVDGVQDTVDETVQGGGGTVDDAVGGAGGTVDDAVGGAGGTVGGAGGTVEGAVGGAGGTVQGAVGGAGGTVQGAVGGEGTAVGGGGPLPPP